MNTISRPALRLMGLVLLLAVLAAGCSARIGVSWPMLDTIELNGKTRLVVGFNQIITLIDPQNRALTQLTDGEGNVRLDEQGNPRVWRLDGAAFDNAQFFGRPLAIEDGLMLFPAYNNRLLKIDIETARLDADDKVGVALDSPVIADLVGDENNIYVPLKFGDVVALDRETYGQAWRARVPEGVWANPVVRDGVVYVAGVDHNLYAFGAQTGELVWPAPIDLEGLAGAAPLITDDGTLYAGSYAHKIFKISPQGEVLAIYEGSNWFWSTPVLYDGTLYATDLGGTVHAINPADMTLVWTQKAASRGIRPAPIVTDAYVVAAARDGIVYWLNRGTGEVVHRREIEGRPEILSDMLLLQPDETTDVNEPMIVIGTADVARLVIAFPLDPQSGYQGWIYNR